MSQSPVKPELPQDPQAIAKLTREYAQNRSLGVVVSLAIFVVLFAAISSSSYLAGEAYRAGNMVLFSLSIALLLPSLTATVYVSVPRWGGKLQERLAQRLYAREGHVALTATTAHTEFWGLMLGGGLTICIIASVILGFTFDIPSRYMQPLSAIYSVPFLVGMWFVMRPMVGYAALLWPALYATHAILIIAGAPIVFASPWDWLNMLIPTAGYGMLSGLAGHLYSRIALRRLRRLTQVELNVADPPKEASGK